MRQTTLPLRVVARYLQATEFSSPEALKEYLKEHPGADKSKHTVAKPEEAKKPEAEKEPHAEKEHGEQKPKKSWKERFKGLTEAAVSFVKNAPKVTKQFIEEDAFRRKTLMSAHKTLTEAPKKMVQNLVETAKHEVKEFKEAGAGIKAVIKGGKMNDHQRKAFKAVATHLAIGAAAAALTASGVGTAMGVFAKGMARHIAMKSVTKALGHLHVIEELEHIGHGVTHFLSHLASDQQSPEAVFQRYVVAAEQGKDLDPDEIMGNFVTAAVAKEMQGFSDEDLEKVMNDVASEKDG
jgi:hypothetical protein